MRKLEPAELPDDVRILRRVHRRQTTIRAGHRLPDRSVFKRRAGGEEPSAYRADLLESTPLGSVDSVLEGKPENGAISISAGQLRELDQEIWEDLDSDDALCGHAHVVIRGPKSQGKKADLVQASIWEREPPANQEAV